MTISVPELSCHKLQIRRQYIADFLQRSRKLAVSERFWLSIFTPRGLLKRVLNIIYLLLYYRLQFLFYNFVIHWLLHLFRGSHPAATMTCGNLCANLSCLVIKHNRKDGAICFATGFRILLPFYEAVLVVYGQISQRMAP